MAHVGFHFDPRKHLFFDQPEILRRIDRATLRYLRTAGGRTRLVARRSLRPRTQVSAPGQPPSSHTKALRESILFGLDPQSDAVVVGPIPLRRPGSPGEGRLGASVLEFGGTLTVQQDGKKRRLRYRARPFMGPALDKVAPTLPALWENSIR